MEGATTACWGSKHSMPPLNTEPRASSSQVKDACGNWEGGTVRPPHMGIDGL